jgi:hypothetical protein
MSAKRWILVGVLAAWLAFTGAAPGAQAQDWLFSVDRNISHVIVNRDGSADIEYWLTFTPAQGAHPIDVMDIGLPNDSYQLSSAQAWYSPGIGGGEEFPLDDIRRSEWLSIGIEVHLDEHTIQPGQQGTIHFRINVKEMVYPDSADENYASVEFAPHYYDSANVRGQTFMEIQFFFPPGVTSEEARYHDQEFDEVDVVGDRLVFIYTYPETTGSTTYKHGISFPKTYVDTVYKAPVVVGGTGTEGGGTSSWFGDLAGCGCPGAVVLIIVGAVAWGAIQSKRRKMAYLPPALSVEGVGIKRGLTAVEAAILLELQLNRILTMILFGLLKKKAVVVQSDDPLKLEAVSPPPPELRPYEEGFLQSIKQDGTLDETKLQEAVVELVKGVNAKMKGFSRKETVAYYKDIVKRAWDQVSAETTPEVKSKRFDRDLEWMMMDDEFEERTDRTFRTGPVFMPPWWAYYRPWVPTVRTAQGGGGRGSASPGRASGSRQVTLPTLPGAAFASAVVGGMERTAGGIVSRLEGFTGHVTQRTNPIPKSSSSGSRSSSFRSGGCACACACACAGCACACAGGGR